MNRRNLNANQEQEVEATSVRPKRIPVGLRPRMAVVGKSPDYVYRWVNDDEGRISMFKAGGWQLCTNDEVDVGNFRAEQETPEGSLASMVVNPTTGGKAYVMKIRKDWYDEDKAAQEADLSQKEREMLTPNTSDGEYGSVRIDRSGRK